MRVLLLLATALSLSACNVRSTDDAADDAVQADSEANATTDNLADTMRSDDEQQAVRAETDIADPEKRPEMQMQVVLDRQGFGPGVIDGKMGLSTKNALRGFQERNGIEVTGDADANTKRALEKWEDIPATRVVRIPEEWGEIEFTKLPDRAPEQAELDALGYESLDEKLAERFHTTVAVLKTLNPGGRPAGAAKPSASPTPEQTKAGTTQGDEASAQSFFTAGQLIRVPNVGADRIAPDAVTDADWQQTLQALGVGTDQPEVARIVVSEKAGTLKAFDADENLVALFTVTTGSENDPLPLGDWKINGIGHNPPFAYNPELFWDVPDDTEKQQLPPGPNGPVGVVWIDLSKEHYGIHGTPAPETIGRAQSHGCVRLTNWDAARLSEMVSNSTDVLFEA